MQTYREFPRPLRVPAPHGVGGSAEIVNPNDLRKKLSNLLRSIDFYHSRLPKEALNKRSIIENQPCGDYQYCVKGAFTSLEQSKSDKSYVPGIADFDNVYYQVILKYKDAVENGYSSAAEAGNTALKDCFKLRSSFPSRGSDVLDGPGFLDYMDRCCEYLRSYATYLDMKITYDVKSGELKEQEAQYQMMAAKVQQDYDRIQRDMLEDPAMREDYRVVTLATTTQELTAGQQALLSQAIDFAVDRALCDLRRKVYERACKHVAKLKLAADSYWIAKGMTPVRENVEEMIDSSSRSV